MGKFARFPILFIVWEVMMQITTMGGISQTDARERSRALTRFTETLPGNGTSGSAAGRMSSSINRKLKFVVNHESNKVIVNVIDGNTNKVIKVLPPEELQRLSNGSPMETGTLFDERI
jgi:flagellar protein FlaG